MNEDNTYSNLSACGNTVNCNNPIVRNFILDSLRYWVSQYHIDMYWSGHDHSREISNYSGVTYIVVDALEDPTKQPYYMVVDMDKEIHVAFEKP